MMTGTDEGGKLTCGMSEGLGDESHPCGQIRWLTKRDQADPVEKEGSAEERIRAEGR